MVGRHAIACPPSQPQFYKEQERQEGEEERQVGRCAGVGAVTGAPALSFHI